MLIIFTLTLSAGVCGGGWWGWPLRLGIYRDPGEGRGQRLAAGGQPALGKTRSQWRGTGQWTVYGNWSVKFNKIDNICILYNVYSTPINA